MATSKAKTAAMARAESVAAPGASMYGADDAVTVGGTHGAAVLSADQFGAIRLSYDGLEIVVTRGKPDPDTRLVFIDTPDVPGDRRGPALRVAVNDGDAVYANPSYDEAAEVADALRPGWHEE